MVKKTLLVGFLHLVVLKMDDEKSENSPYLYKIQQLANFGTFPELILVEKGRRPGSPNTLTGEPTWVYFPA
jgi:hypothetical protein